MITAEEIKNTLEKAFPVSTIELQDLTGGGDHWQLLIVSPAFEGKGLLEQHRMVNEALRDPMQDQRIHALTLKLFTPSQWEKLGR
ncbi:MAG TPA: BolA family transcriptional regulator [candidate division Zixibacteria bacterium]|nr:BolA family transcriptional regulator [candidate division Zixibacteria bacterium]